jgi:hypothetical protein
MGYFIRRSDDDSAAIALHPDNREEVIASGLAIGDAEDLCASRIEAMRTAAALPSMELAEGPPPPVRSPRARDVRLARLAAKLGILFSGKSLQK